MFFLFWVILLLGCLHRFSSSSIPLYRCSILAAIPLSDLLVTDLRKGELCLKYSAAFKEKPVKYHIISTLSCFPLKAGRMTWTAACLCCPATPKQHQDRWNKRGRHVTLQTSLNPIFKCPGDAMGNENSRFFVSFVPQLKSETLFGGRCSSSTTHQKAFVIHKWVITRYDGSICKRSCTKSE